MSAKTIAGKQKARKNRKRNFLIFAGVIVLALGGWVLWNAFQATQPQAAASNEVEGLAIGNIAPDFSLPTLDGDIFTLSEQRGEPTIVFFMAYWCGTCIPEAQALAQLKAEYGEGINIVAIDVDASSTTQALEQFKQAAGGETLTWAFDTGQQVANSYQVRSLDTTLVLNAEGVIVYRDEFPSPYKTLKEALTKVGI